MFNKKCINEKYIWKSSTKYKKKQPLEHSCNLKTRLEPKWNNYLRTASGHTCASCILKCILQRTPIHRQLQLTTATMTRRLHHGLSESRDCRTTPTHCFCFCLTSVNGGCIVHLCTISFYILCIIAALSIFLYNSAQCRSSVRRWCIVYFTCFWYLTCALFLLFAIKFLSVMNSWKLRHEFSNLFYFIRTNSSILFYTTFNNVQSLRIIDPQTKPSDRKQTPKDPNNTFENVIFPSNHMPQAFIIKLRTQHVYFARKITTPAQRQYFNRPIKNWKLVPLPSSGVKRQKEPPTRMGVVQL